MRNKILFIVAGIFAFLILLVVSSSVSAVNATVCCSKTTSGLYCQNVPSEQCALGSTQAPTSCEGTSFCKGGYCYDSSEGTCSANTPQQVCNQNNGTWNAEFPAQCQLGCCILGDQAAFVPLVRCKKLSGFLGLVTNYNKQITSEVACVLSVQNQDTGACVYDSDFERTCKFTTRSQCDSGINGTTSSKGQFFKGKLCSDEELGTNCGPTDQTICVPGKDGVYFKDSCGNAANVYDASKLKDKSYWANVQDPSESCGAGKDNSNNPSCGNCNYLLGSFCRDSKSAGSKATYGTNICANLNCKNTENGESYKHGESWCVYNDKGTTNQGDSTVGSRFYKHICINGQEILEQCADFRQQECIQDTIKTPLGDFSQAACRVNRWQDCLIQGSQQDCENEDQRDCTWKPGLALGNNKSKVGVCVPQNPPGLQFWTGTDAKSVCAQGNSQCTVVYEQGLFGSPKCVKGCECLAAQWTQDRLGICRALGDCGDKVNWLGQPGYKQGYTQVTSSGKGKEKAAAPTTTASATGNSNIAPTSPNPGTAGTGG